MRPVRVLSVYLAVVFVGGALLAPWIYRLVQAGATTFPSWQSLAGKPFPRYVNRALLILALVGLVPFLRRVDLCSWRALGLGWRRDIGFQLRSGFALGFASLACLVVLALGAGARQLAADLTMARVFSHTLKAGLTAALVACLEEVIFRGALFGALRKTFHWSVALAGSSVFFALVHFLQPPAWRGTVVWDAGGTVLLGMAAGFSDCSKVFPAFLNLTLVGVILGFVFQRTGALYFSIGLHAGWIFWVKTYAFLTEATGNSHVGLFGTGKLIDGWLALGILTVAFALIAWRSPQPAGTLGGRERTRFH